MKKTLKKYILSISLVSSIMSGCAQQERFPDDDIIDNSNFEYLTKWEEGYLDIHQISTGRGNCTFIIMPDGTTMMVDVGDLGDAARLTQEIMPAVPNLSKRPAEWIHAYIKNFIEPTGKDWLDYVMITHFDPDHIGFTDRLAISNPNRPYKLTGVSHLAELIDIKLLVDRGWPDYNYPDVGRFNAEHIDNYIKYANYRHAQGKPIEGFIAGTKDQFKLLHSPQKYPDFEIRNIYANGRIWTGSGSNTRELFPAISSLPTSQYPNENRCSNVFTLKYGTFDYFSGGDIIGVITANQPSWYDMETPIGELIGPMDVVLTNHHSFSDAMNANFIRSTKPQAFIIPVWDYYHPQPDPLARMLSEDLYAGHREIYAAGLVKNNATRLGDPGKKIKPSGHIVTRVYAGGEKFQIFVLNERSTQYEIIYKSDIFNSK